MSFSIRAMVAINDGPETLYAAGSTDANEAEDIYRSMLREQWENENEDEPFPDDLDEAKEGLENGLAGFSNSFWFEEVNISSPQLSEIIEAAELASATINPSTEHLTRLRKAIVDARENSGGPLVEKLPVFQSFDFEIEGSQDCPGEDAIPIKANARIHFHEAKKMWQIADACRSGLMESGLLRVNDAMALDEDGTELNSINVEYQVYKYELRIRGEASETFESWFTKEIFLNRIFEHFELPLI